MLSRLIAAIAALAFAAGAAAAGPVHVYGPGGLAPAMREAAASFGAKAFAANLASPVGRIFARWGWMVPKARVRQNQPSH